MSEPKVTIGWVPEFFMHEDGSLTQNPDWVKPEPFSYENLADWEIIDALRGWLDDVPGELALVAADRLEHYCTQRETLLDAHAKQVEKEDVPCSTHPDAPHGFCRNASHSADRYVCECEGWEPSEYNDLNKEIARLSKIEDLALDVVTADTWNGDEFYDCLCRLKDALGEG